MTKEEAIETIKDICLTTEQLTRVENALECLLSQPSLPSSLDEAAEEFGKRQGVELAPFTKKFFKAGAEWMAGQGITLEGRASRKYENDLAGFVSWILFDQQKAAHLLVNQGEEADVIINIRKK